MSRAPKLCNHPGCVDLVPAGTRCCTEHHQAGWNRSPRTASAGRTGNRAWREQRAKVLQRDGHQCQLRLPGCTVIATEVDHVIAVHLGGGDANTNLQAACHPCHVRKTATEAAAAR